MFGLFSRKPDHMLQLQNQFAHISFNLAVLQAHVESITRSLVKTPPEPVAPKATRASPINYLTSNYPSRIDKMVIGEVVYFSVRDGFDPTGYRKALGAYGTKRYGRGSCKARIDKDDASYITLTRLY